MRSRLISSLALQEPSPAPSGSSQFAITGGQLADSGSAGPAFQDLKDRIAEFPLVNFVNRGAWSMHELLLFLVGITGPAHLVISSYALSETAARTLALLKQERHLITITALIDNRIDTRSAGSLQLLRSIADRITLCACHAKVTLLYNSRADLTVIGSANYTENKRFEVGTITSCRETRLFHQKWIDNAIEEFGQYNP